MQHTPVTAARSRAGHRPSVTLEAYMPVVSNGFLRVSRAAFFPLAGLLIVGCAEDPDTNPTNNIQSAHVQGSFQAPDPSDPDGIWIGTEVVEGFGPGGVLCSREWQMEAVEIDSEEGCSSCSVTLELLASEGEPAGTECSESIDALGRVHYDLPIIGFAPSMPGPTNSEHGDIYLQQEADWDLYSTGSFDGTELVYLRSTLSPVGGSYWSNGVKLSDDDPSLPEI